MTYQGSIKKKLISIIILVSTITAFIGYSSFVYWFVNEQHKKSVELSHTIGLVLSQNIAKLILLNDVSVAVDISSSLQSFEKVNRIAIYNLDKKVIYKYSNNNESFNIRAVEEHFDEVVVKDNYIEIFTDVKYQDTKLGYIYLNISVRTVWDVVQENFMMILMLWITMFSASYLLAIYYAREFTNPILKLVSFLEEIESIDIFDKPLMYNQNNEYGKLYKEVNFMLKRVQQGHNSLIEHQNNLENIIKEKIAENTKQLEVLQQQTKLAAMGEMVGAIAHQWRQPLNEITTSIQNLKYDFIEKKLDDEAYIKEFIDKNKRTIQFMSKTIDDFRSFFRVDKEKVDFNVKEATLAVVDMQSAQLKDNNIELNIIGDEFICHGMQNEYQQVILNLVNNAKDALVENSVENPMINIFFESKKIYIEDNAGGIKAEIIDRIFEPYFTTKEQGSGTGMGLYLSKIIVEDNIGGKLEVENVENGARFTIELCLHKMRLA